MFTLAIFCLTMSYLPWFTYLTFHVSMQSYILQHQTLLSPPGTTTAEHHFCFGPVTSFFLEHFIIVLHSSPVAYWTPSEEHLLGSLSSIIISFCLIILFMGFSQQKYWSGLPFPLPVNRILSELSTMTLDYYDVELSTMILGDLNDMAQNFPDLCKPLCHDKAVIHEGHLLPGKLFLIGGQLLYTMLCWFLYNHKGFDLGHTWMV